MKNLFALALLALAATACDRQDRINANPTPTQSDNTSVNVRDGNMNTLTPGSPSESEGDRMITERIREVLISDPNLSTSAKNIKVITTERVVTLRGPVLNAQEKQAIERIIQQIQGIERVDNQLEFSSK